MTYRLKYVNVVRTGQRSKMNNPQCHNQHDTVLPRSYSMVDEYLIRGPHPSISTLIQLKKKSCGVTQIYDFRHISIWHFKFIERWCCKFLGIKYIRVPYSNLYGVYPGLAVFEEIAKSVKQNGIQGGKTLFHCNSGRHRTSHFSMFYKLTRGQPLHLVQKQLASEYENTVLKIVQEQVIDQNYYDRPQITYKGVNPWKRFMAQRNNIISLATKKAHLHLMSRLGM